MATPILAYTPPYGLPPIPLPDGTRIRWEYHPEIVALLTSEDTPSLAGLVTAGYFAVTSRVVLGIDVDGEREEENWDLLDGTATLSDVSPDDYDPISNVVRWSKVG
jgi:hypothetical protein